MSEPETKTPRLSGAAVHKILTESLPPDDPEARVLGGLMLEFVERLCEAEQRIGKLWRFCPALDKKVEALEAKLANGQKTADAGAVEAASTNGTAPAAEEEEPPVYVGPPEMAPPGAAPPPDPTPTSTPSK